MKSIYISPTAIRSSLWKLNLASYQTNTPLISNSQIKKLKPINLLLWILCGSAFLTISGCKKFVEVPGPVTSINSATVYTTDATASAVLTGIYSQISANTFSQPGLTSTSFITGLSSDELKLFGAISNTGFQLYYKNAVDATTTAYRIDFWSGIYPTIFTANSAIEGLTQSSSLTPAVKQQLLGEAKFIRAFCYFHLVNFYGNVPLALTSDYTINATLTNAPKAQVYQQIITDLKDAQSLLSSSFLDATVLKVSTERARPSKWSATALLARAYLYSGDYANAAVQASSLISNSSVFSLSSLNNAFLRASAGNSEAIWQLQPVLSNGLNTVDGATFILPATGPSDPSYPVSLSPAIISAFERGDQRRKNWIDSINVGGTIYYYAHKYKSATLNAPVTEYNMVLRLGEQYLIRAEAEANGAGNGINDAINDLNVIRSRAGLPNYSGATDKASLLTAILHERQVEFFTEWGHRWFDLKRTQNVDLVMGIATPLKGGTWTTNQQLYPIPQTEIQKDPNLKQNPGY